MLPHPWLKYMVITVNFECSYNRADMLDRFFSSAMVCHGWLHVFKMTPRCRCWRFIQSRTEYFLNTFAVFHSCTGEITPVLFTIFGTCSYRVEKKDLVSSSAQQNRNSCVTVLMCLSVQYTLEGIRIPCKKLYHNIVHFEVVVVHALPVQGRYNLCFRLYFSHNVHLGLPTLSVL